MNVVHSDQPIVRTDIHSIFLAGPTPRTKEVQSWRVRALELLNEADYQGTVFVPEHKEHVENFDYDTQVEWEYQGLEDASVIMFWIPRNLTSLPGFTTNVEFGYYIRDGKIVYGRPVESPKNKYLDWKYRKAGLGEPCETLAHTVKKAIELALRNSK